MAQTFKWVAPEAIVTALTTELNALANGSVCAVSSAVTNETGGGLYTFIDYSLTLASLTPTTGGFLIVMLTPTLDGTNYADVLSGDLDRWSTTMIVETSASAKLLMKENVPIPPLDFKLAVYNQAGVALGATGNILKYRRHYGQAV